ncbi:MAG: SurA N-terminal domain-containing protein [Chloracidobacterium sp.]|nr:SurA N-terminal domain-containing protein [Chloracidobacterium sp.]
MSSIKFRSLAACASAFLVLFIASCTGDPAGPAAGPGAADPNEVAARVNGKDIKLEEVEKGVKAQAQGEELNFSPLELASARLTVLQQLIQAEVMFQKAEAEQSVPTDEEVTTEMNNRRTGSGLSAEEFDRQMKEAGETEQTWRQNVRKELALKKLQEKITGRVVSPKDKEIEDFYNGNKEQFKNKRGAQLAAIVIDPSNSGQGDLTTNEDQARAKATEVYNRTQAGADFATLAREASEDLQTRSQGGDWRYFTEDEMKQTMGPQVTELIMTRMQNGQVVPAAIPLEGKILIVKLQRKQEQDEDLTLESPGVRQRVNELLVNARKNLLWQSYSAVAINEAKVENFLARKVVENPNDLSGARPGPAPQANTNAASNTSANANSNSAANGGTNSPANANSNSGNSTASNSASNANSNRPANANNSR